MSSVTVAQSFIWVWAGLGFLTALGLSLLLRALFPERRGDTPYCGRCGYNLTGMEKAAASPESGAADVQPSRFAPAPAITDASQLVLTAPGSTGVALDELRRCPECGVEIGVKSVVFGERRVARARLVLGLALTLLGAGSLIGFGVAQVRQVDWYRFWPTGWVVADIRAGGKAASRAIAEIGRRLAADQLDADQRAKVIDACLPLHEQGNGGWGGSGATDLLGLLYSPKSFSDGQSKRFFEAMVRLKLGVRPVVIEGYDCPCAIQWLIACPRKGVAAEWKLAECSIDGKAADALQMWSAWQPLARYSSGVNSFSRFRRPGIGHHAVHCEYLIRAGPESSDIKNAPAYGARLIANAEFDVAVDEPSDYFRVRHDPELSDVVSHGLTFDLRAYPTFSTDGFPFEWGIMGFIMYNAGLTGDLAFDILWDRGDAGLVSIGRIALSRDKPLAVLTNEWDGKPQGAIAARLRSGELKKPPAAMNLILRSSKRAALECNSTMNDIWDGEVRIHNVPLRAMNPQQGTSASGSSSEE